ncbi:unnamed protein product [Caretta caretta]
MPSSELSCGDRGPKVAVNFRHQGQAQLRLARQMQLTVAVDLSLQPVRLKLPSLLSVPMARACFEGNLQPNNCSSWDVASEIILAQIRVTEITSEQGQNSPSQDREQISPGKEILIPRAVLVLLLITPVLLVAPTTPPPASLLRKGKMPEPLRLEVEQLCQLIPPVSRQPTQDRGLQAVPLCLLRFHFKSPQSFHPRKGTCPLA